MKKVIWIVVVVLVVLFISGSCSAYNRMVTAEETVNTTWADVEAQYQRRSDLIPNLVNTVKGYAAHEQSTFTEVVEARAQAMSFKLDAADLTPEKLAEFQQAQQKVGSALGRTLFCRREVLIKISGIAVKIPDKFLYFCSLNYHG